MTGYWMYEESGVLRAAVTAYLAGAMTATQVAAMRAYLRQWIADPVWRGDMVDQLRAEIDGLDSLEAIRDWLEIAEEECIEPI